MKPISIFEHTDYANIVTRVVVEHEGKYLCVQEGKAHVRGRWAFCGGKVDVGELLTESAAREVMEETGVTAEMTGILTIQHLLWSDRPGFTLEVDFLAKAVQIPDVFPLSEEVLAVEWKTLEEIEELTASGEIRNQNQSFIGNALRSGNVMPLTSLNEVGVSVTPTL